MNCPLGDQGLSLKHLDGTSSLVHSSDSTLGAGLESIKHMTKAASYARVSTDAQQKEGTIESQIVELKRQIAAAGHVLVKEYVDNGYSGGLLDRPGLEQLRKDVKTGVFDAIYFLCTDRIARDVAHQLIIIGELLKHGKQITINGKNYEQNPENKFTLTVMGAVAELERAKIMERTMRGKLHRVRSGYVIGQGLCPYGYDFVKRTATSTAAFVINERQAQVIRSIFEMYASGAYGLKAIARSLEERCIPTRLGKQLWSTFQVRYILQNHTYAGTRYYNQMTTTIRPPADKRVKKRGKYVYRDRSEWIGVKVPAIVSQELFDRVQVRLQQAERQYRQPDVHYLLANLVTCGECGSAYSSYKRYVTVERVGGNPHVYHKSAYRCTWRSAEGVHDRSRIERCHNPEIRTRVLESAVLSMIRNVVLNPTRLGSYIDATLDSKTRQDRNIERELASITVRIAAIDAERRRMTESYALGQMHKEAYIGANIALDQELEKLEARKAEAIAAMPREADQALEESITQFCDRARVRFERCGDFDSKRKFVLEHIEGVIYRQNRVIILGSVPIERTGSKLPFRIDHEIDRTKVCGRRPSAQKSQHECERQSGLERVETPIAAVLPQPQPVTGAVTMYSDATV
jgi:site-specific DNA recombinase